MKANSKHSVIFSILLAAIATCAFAPHLYAQNDQAVVAGQKAIMEGAKQMMEGSKKIMAVLQKQGLVDEQIQALNKQMMEGRDLVMRGHGMMSGNTMARGQEMMKRGVAMILKAHTDMVAAVEKKGMTRVCAIDLHECHYAVEKMQHGALQWYFGTTGF